MIIVYEQTNEIVIVRGNTGVIDIELYEDDGITPYELKPGDELVFKLKHSTLNLSGSEYMDTDPLLVKVIQHEPNLNLSFVPSDTAELGFGRYEYDITFTSQDGSVVDTVIKHAPFTIERKV